MQLGQPCQGENCQGRVYELQPGQELREGQELQPGQNIQPKVLTEPESEGDIAPGDAVPLIQVQPMEPQQPTPNEILPPPTSFIINTDSFIGSLIYALFEFLTNR